ncbi:hypothetical protein ElyMa_005055500 [Elysia marginata]|uniref:Uncharacterized protein n=1 Tax=Elysia marginata TaxID=1093978 RepID=A0AAV4JF48_9GAST|nr:hypothetical protein ElyMa_005055500 [Elysia marginata]
MGWSGIEPAAAASRVRRANHSAMLGSAFSFREENLKSARLEQWNSLASELGRGTSPSPGVLLCALDLSLPAVKAVPTYGVKGKKGSLASYKTC